MPRQAQPRAEIYSASAEIAKLGMRKQLSARIALSSGTVKCVRVHVAPPYYIDNHCLNANQLAIVVVGSVIVFDTEAVYSHLPRTRSDMTRQVVTGQPNSDTTVPLSQSDQVMERSVSPTDPYPSCSLDTELRSTAAEEVKVLRVAGELHRLLQEYSSSSRKCFRVMCAEWTILGVDIN
ncbi:hypothetical protein J6590_034254 [Homalodisca vitripennis]|nr:hypothetical protein J6590_034254 [Homalodisca vitripennis]